MEIVEDIQGKLLNNTEQINLRDNYMRSILASFLLLFFVSVSLGKDTLRIKPSVGILGVIELGMNPQDIMSKIDQYDLEETIFYSFDSGSGCIETNHLIRLPDLGVSTGFLVSNKVSRINIIVDPSLKRNRFFGEVVGGISFASDKGVSRQSVIDAYGEIIVVNAKNFREFYSKGVNISYGDSSGNSETLYYPARGIRFNIKNNLVHAVYIVCRVQGPKTNLQKGSVYQGECK